MRWETGLGLRLLTHMSAAILAMTIAFIGIVAVVVGFLGTGGFTADPAPDHPNFLGIAAALAVCIALEAALFLAWRKVIRLLDVAEAK